MDSLNNVAKNVDAAIKAAQKLSDIINDAPWGRQLQAARYYVHKLIIKKYGDCVRAGMIDEEKGAELYAEAMANYDGVIAESTQGHAAEAMERSMAEGFVV